MSLVWGPSSIYNSWAIFLIFIIINGLNSWPRASLRQRRGLRWSELAQKVPIHPWFECRRVVRFRKYRRRQWVPLLGSAHKERGSIALRANQRNIYQERVEPSRASEGPMVEWRGWDKLMQLRSTLPEVQPVEHWQPGNFSPMGQWLELSRKLLDTNQLPGSTFHWVQSSELVLSWAVP